MKEAGQEFDETAMVKADMGEVVKRGFAEFGKGCYVHRGVGFDANVACHQDGSRSLIGYQIRNVADRDLTAGQIKRIAAIINEGGN